MIIPKFYIEFINRSIAHEFLYLMFNLPRFINSIFVMDRFNKLYITCTQINILDQVFSTVYLRQAMLTVSLRSNTKLV